MPAGSPFRAAGTQGRSELDEELMATPLHMKRMARERVNLEKPNDDYFVYFDDDNLLSFHAYVMGPSETLYAHKFVKLKIEIPQKYPLIPPKVTFVQHTGGRLHPNLYVEGKVCLSILGTWPGEKWAFAMTIETVLITIRSLLDNSPYKHEPHQGDHPNFNKYVQYASWKSLLLDYVNNERNPKAKAFLQKYITENGTNILNELQRQTKANTHLNLTPLPYGLNGAVNYLGTMRDVMKMVNQCTTLETRRLESVITSPQETDQHDSSLIPNAISLSPPTEVARPQCQVMSPDTPDPSPLKRKREVIDLT